MSLPTKTDLLTMDWGFQGQPFVSNPIGIEPPSTNINKLSGISYASLKKVSGIAIASIKKIIGVS